MKDQPSDRNKQLYIIAVVAIVAIVAFVGIRVIDSNDNDMNMGNMMNSAKQENETNSAGVDVNSMDYKMYAALKGEDYDRMFIANMIAHHQGAVDMAKLAPVQANHQELKDFAEQIISDQTKEISDMTSWQSAWGYPASSGEMMMDHSSMGMMSSMADMTNELKNLTGDAFDKKFMELMIEHHQSAVNMAYSGPTNAYHQEVKTLTKNITTNQINEINKMKMWQKDWGY